MKTRPVQVARLVRRWTALLERHRQAALAEFATDSAWQAGYCEGLAHAQHLLRNGGA